MTFTQEKELINIIKKSSGRMKPQETGEKPSLRPLKNIRAVLFDIYGTLFISEAGDISHADKSQASNRIFLNTIKEAGIDTSLLDREKLSDISSLYITEIKKEHKKLKSKGFDFPEIVITEIWAEILKKITDKKFSEKELERISLIYESSANRTYPMPGAEKIIDLLNKNNFITGLISNAQFYTPLLFTAHFGRTVENMGFDSDLSVFSYLFRKGKPDPFLFSRASGILYKKYNVLPEQVLYTGNDMLNDISAAKSAGMKTALFAGDRRSLRLRENNPACSRISPDTVITKLSQIRDIII